MLVILWLLKLCLVTSRQVVECEFTSAETRILNRLHHCLIVLELGVLLRLFSTLGQLLSFNCSTHGPAATTADHLINAVHVDQLLGRLADNHVEAASLILSQILLPQNFSIFRIRVASFRDLRQQPRILIILIATDVFNVMIYS